MNSSSSSNSTVDCRKDCGVRDGDVNSSSSSSSNSTVDCRKGCGVRDGDGNNKQQLQQRSAEGVGRPGRESKQLHATLKERAVAPE